MTSAQVKPGRGLRDMAIVGLGELLWDLLPGGRQLGGAPANFAVMASRLGAHGMIASRLGQDELGEAARSVLATMPVDTRFLQRDQESHPTGSVSVELNDGQPQYTIHEPVAWDFLELTPAWQELAARADAVCFGLLAQRNSVSRTTIHSFLEQTRPECVRVFDVNLRKPFISGEAVCASLKRATILKLNETEMPQLLSLAGLREVAAMPPAMSLSDGVATDVFVEWLARAARRILDAWPLRMVAITLGAHGSLLVTREQTARHHGVPTTVVDAVGAGDAFTASLTTHYLQGASLTVLNEAGNRWGSWVASQAGAMPQLPEETRARIGAAIASAGERSQGAS